MEKKPTTRLILPKHHSLADWDYRPGCLFGLYTDQYVSSPSCLRQVENPPASTTEPFYLKAALAPCIPDGRVVDWRRYQDWDNSYGGYLFRCQDTPFDTLPLNCYQLHQTTHVCQLIKRVGGAETFLFEQEFDPHLGNNEWHHLRVTFWQYIGGDLASVLVVSFEVEVDEEWVELWRFEHPDNLWADEEVNRIGFYGRADTNNHYHWRDNTEIWKAIE